MSVEAFRPRLVSKPSLWQLKKKQKNKALRKVRCQMLSYPGPGLNKKIINKSFQGRLLTQKWVAGNVRTHNIVVLNVNWKHVSSQNEHDSFNIITMSV